MASSGKRFVQDLAAVAKRAWFLVIGGGLVSAVGAGQQVLRQVHDKGGWHWPSWYWILPFLLALIIAQQLVIADRRRPNIATRLADLSELEDLEHEANNIYHNQSHPDFSQNFVEIKSKIMSWFDEHEPTFSPSIPTEHGRQKDYFQNETGDVRELHVILMNVSHIRSTLGNRVEFGED